MELRQRRLRSDRRCEVRKLCFPNIGIEFLWDCDPDRDDSCANRSSSTDESTQAPEYIVHRRKQGHLGEQRLNVDNEHSCSSRVISSCMVHATPLKGLATPVEGLFL